MKKNVKGILMCSFLIMGLTGCDKPQTSIYPDEDENIDLSKAIKLDVDLNQIVAPTA